MSEYVPVSGFVSHVRICVPCPDLCSMSGFVSHVKFVKEGEQKGRRPEAVFECEFITNFINSSVRNSDKKAIFFVKVKEKLVCKL